MNTRFNVQMNCWAMSELMRPVKCSVDNPRVVVRNPGTTTHRWPWTRQWVLTSSSGLPESRVLTILLMASTATMLEYMKYLFVSNSTLQDILWRLIWNSHDREMSMFIWFVHNPEDKHRYFTWNKTAFFFLPIEILKPLPWLLCSCYTGRINIYA